MNTVPKAITPSLLDFCRKISDGQPHYIPLKPIFDGRMQFCFDNVAQKIQRDGGTIVYGWAIWHVPGLYYEAEHHGVWRHPNGTIEDVSPQFDPMDYVLFLPDPLAIYNPNSFRTNILEAADTSEIALEFATLAKVKNDIIRKYRTNEYTDFMPSYDDQEQLYKLDNQLNELYNRHASPSV